MSGRLASTAESGLRGDDLRRVLEVVEDYVEGFEHADAERLRRAMHPQCRLTATIDGRLVMLGRDEFIAAIAGRPSASGRAASTGRPEHVLLASAGSPTTAVVRVRTADARTTYVDDLQLLRLEAGWTIIAKSWHPEPER